MPILNLDAVHASLPDTMADEAELNRVLRRIGKIPEWDGAILDEYRLAVFHNRLVVQAEDGRIVKGELPKRRSFSEIENERHEALRVQERKERFGPGPEGGAGWISTSRDGSDTMIWTEDTSGSPNPVRVQTVALINEVVAERFIALEERVSDLQEQLAALTPLEIVA
jgi:hypothetical protein